MNTPFEKIFHKIQYATQVKGRQLLHDLEADPAELQRFCRQAQRLPAAKAIVLCPLLSGMQAPEFMDLLRVYSLRSEEDLQAAALEGLRNASAAARSTVIFSLLAEENETVRQAACSILGTENSESAAKILIGLLREASAGIVISALEGLRNIPVPAAMPECARLLHRPEEPVRLLALQVMERCDAALPAEAVIRVLQKDTSNTVRQAAARALGRKPDSEAAQALISALRPELQHLEVRQEVARALHAYPSRETAQALFCTYAHNLSESTLAQLCRNSLLQIPESVLMELCESFIDSSSPVERLEAATLAGMFSNDRAKALLWSRLRQEKDPLIIAGLLEEAGKCGACGVWDTAMQKMSDEPVVAYLAAQTLARLLIPARLMEFAQILLQRNYGHLIQEVILERLGSYGRARGLPPELADILVPFLREEYANVAVLAAEAVCSLPGETTVRVLLEAYSDAMRPEVQSSVCRGILYAANNSLRKILELAGEDNLLKVSAVLSRMHEVKQGECDAEYFIMMAALAQRKKTYAHLCLTLSACLKPKGLSDAIHQCTGGELHSLLPVWQVLSEDTQLNAPVPWVRLLNNADPAIRLLALQTIPRDYPLDLLGEIADLAFSDPDAGVMAQATESLRRCLSLNRSRNAAHSEEALHAL